MTAKNAARTTTMTYVCAAHLSDLVQWAVQNHTEVNVLRIHKSPDRVCEVLVIWQEHRKCTHEAYALVAYWDEAGPCVCNVGVQECPVHPGRLLDAYGRMDFEKAWDADFKAAQNKETM